MCSKMLLCLFHRSNLIAQDMCVLRVTHVIGQALQLENLDDPKGMHFYVFYDASILMPFCVS